MHCFPLKTLCSVESRITNHPWPGGMITLCVPVTSVSWIHVWHLFGDIQKFLILHLKMKTRTPLSSEAQTRAACSQFSKKEISFDKMLTEGGVLTSQAPPPIPTSTIFTLQAVQSVHRRQNSHPSWMNSFWLVTMLLMGTKKKKPPGAIRLIWSVVQSDRQISGATQWI